MANESKRQSTLLLVLGIAIVAATVRFGGLLPGSEMEMDPADLPEIDAEGISRSLRNINTVDAGLVNFIKADSDADRDLFQYGAPRPTPEDVERRRLAEQAAVQRQEEIARAEKAREAELLANPPKPQDPADVAAQAAAQEAHRLVQEQAWVQAQQAVPAVPAGPVRQPPPPINFRFLGVMGPPEKKVAVFMEGDNMVLARKGEVIQGKFKVLEIAVEWAEIGYTDPQHKDFKKRLNFGM